MRHEIPRWLPLTVLLAVCAAVLTLWAFVVPIFESPDEPHHWVNAQYIHSQMDLPPYNSTYLEGNQAPLYYVLMAPLAGPSATPEVTARLVGGGFVVPCPPHLFKNCPSDIHKYWPIRRVRLATAGLSLVAVLFTALAASEITQSLSCAIIAGTLIGFLPQFDFRGATVNNDAGAVVFSAVATYFIVRMAVRGFELLPAVLGAIAVALAFLSKINAVAVAPAFVACLLVTAPDWKSRLQRLWVPALSGLIVLPWLLRNKSVYGDFLGSHVMLRTVPIMVHKQSLRSAYFFTTFPQLTLRSFVGYFGWMNVPLPEAIYKGYVVLAVLSLAGLVFLFLRRRKQSYVVVLLASIPIVSLAVVIDFNLTFPQPQGRLLFPCLSAVAILAAIGLGTIARVRKYLAATVLLACLSVNGYALKEVIYPAYWGKTPPPRFLDTFVPDTMMRGQPPGPLLAGHRFTQSFTAEHDALSSVEVEVTGYGRSMSHGHITISLSESQDGPSLASSEWPVSAIPNCCVYARMAFPPLSHSAGKTYFISLSTEGVVPPDAVTVFLSGADVYPRGEFLVDGKRTGQDTSFRTFYTPPNSSCNSCSDARAAVDVHRIIMGSVANWSTALSLYVARH